MMTSRAPHWPAGFFWMIVVRSRSRPPTQDRHQRPGVGKTTLLDASPYWFREDFVIDPKLDPGCEAP